MEELIIEDKFNEVKNNLELRIQRFNKGEQTNSVDERENGE